MELITRRVILELEGGDPTKEVLEEYADPDSEKYAAMVKKNRRKAALYQLALSSIGRYDRFRRYSCGSALHLLLERQRINSAKEKEQLSLRIAVLFCY